MKGEFKKLYRLNSLFLDQTAEFLSPRTGLPMKVLKMDYELPASALRPAADPNYMSDAQRMNQAQALVQRASPALGYDMRQVDLFYLRAWKIPGAETFIPVGQDGQNAIQGGQDPKVQVEQLKQQGKQQLFQMETQLKLMELMEEHELNKAKIMQLEAQAASFLAEADGKKEGHQLAALDAALGIEKARSDSHSQSLRLLHETMKHNDEMQMRQKELDLQGAQLAAQAKEGTSTGGD
jgi:hypothetical protein